MPLPPSFHLQVYENVLYPSLSNPKFISKEEEHNIMASKNTVEPTIVVVGKVVSSKLISGKTQEGKAFKYTQLTITTGNGNHWDSVKARKDADKATLSVFASAKEGDIVSFADCFLQTFEYNGKPCVSILAGKAFK